jgi:hypothetical protein
MILHGVSKNTADNPDTLNEVQVCGAENLIRFKTVYFQVMGKRDGVEARRGKKKTRWVRCIMPVLETAKKEHGEKNRPEGRPLQVQEKSRAEARLYEG